MKVHGRGRSKSKANLRRQKRAVPGRKVGSANEGTFLQEIQRLRRREEKAVREHVGGQIDECLTERIRGHWKQQLRGMEFTWVIFDLSRAAPHN